MNAELEALGRRAVACEHWRWRQGMSLSDGTIVVRVSDIRPVVSGGASRGGNALSEVYPDLSDPATLGALLGLVREAWQDPYLHCQYVLAELGQPDCWLALTDCGIGSRDFAARTEAEALVCALEAAP